MLPLRSLNWSFEAMTEIKDLDDAQKNDVTTKALAYWKEHRSHINQLMNSGTVVYPPSGSAILRPSLWNGGSWRWFVQNGFEVR
jgi:hypothetical protein